MIVLKSLLILMFGSARWFTIAVTSLSIAGYWGIFQKCGLKGWYALIPCYREYCLARCANREGEEGRVLFFSSVADKFLLLGIYLIPNAGDTLLILMTAVDLALHMVGLVYMIRVAMGLCEVFRQRKLWVWLWASFECIPALIWGFVKGYQPAYQVQDVSKAVESFFSNTTVEAMAEGLTVNLEERKAREMFTEKTLLQDVHFYIKPGSMVLLLGGSGAGKTTLVNAVNGYEKAKARITLNGSDVYGDYKHMQYEIGFVPQQDLMRMSDTVLHTLNDAAALRLPQQFSAADRRARVNEVMDLFGLQPVKNSLAGKLSGGQRKRLSIAMEFISNPSLFILDEPDSGLDGVMARELMEQLRKIADQGKIVIVITHTPDRVIDLFDDVIVLAKDQNRVGRLAYFGTIEDAKAFFDRDSMEKIVRCVNRKEEGGDGMADELIRKYAEVQHG